MKIGELKKIVEQEKLIDANICEDRAFNPEETVLKRDGNKWIVAVTSERCSLVQDSVFTYDNEDEACEHFLKRLRAGNKAKSLWKKIRSRG